MNQTTLGADFATNRNLAMPVGDGQVKQTPLFDVAELRARAARRKLVEQGQQELTEGK